MSTEYFYGTGRSGAPKRAGKPSGPGDPRGKAASGRITKIMFGQGHGYISLRDDREVYFHRSDSKEGTAFNDLRVGDTVTFELLEDAVSGARALRVRRTKKRRNGAA
jgi:cold shock CspA family protein